MLAKGERTIEAASRKSRTDTYPEAPAPDPHVPLLHYVIKIGSHPGRPATPAAGRAHPKWLWAGWRAGSRGGVGAGRKLRRGSGFGCGAASERAHHFLWPPTPTPESGRPARSHFGGARRREARLERRRQLTHPPACREEERRLLRDPALPPPPAQEEEEEDGGGGRRGGAAPRGGGHPQARAVVPGPPARLVRPAAPSDPSLLPDPESAPPPADGAPR